MMRALWSAASGMISQQANVDTISNNIANVNTTGFKGDKAEFKTLLYQTIQTRTTTANGAQKPIPAQVGLGTRLASTTTNFSQGAMLASESPTAFALTGDGFFAVRGETGETYFTRNGDFHWSVGTTGMTLATADGLPVLDSEGNPIVLPADIPPDRVTFTTKTGELGYINDDGQYVSLEHTIGTWQFNNPAGLDKLSGTRYAVTDASGQPMNEATTDGLIKSGIINKYLEGSNVQVADEMVNLIVAQRAYEMNSKAIQASDDMLGQANSLKR